jgi:cystathionine beta-lyase/cystathionine gamma-synthase
MYEKITTPHTPESIKDQGALFMAGKLRETDAYARYGYQEERAWEGQLAEKIGVPEVAVTNSGMAAIHTATEAEGLRPGETILVSTGVYDCTGDLFLDLKKRGIKVVTFKPGNTKALEELAQQNSPRSIFFESVANSPEMRVTDIESVIKFTDQINEQYQERTPAKLLDKRIATRFRERYSSLDEEAKQEILSSITTFNKTNNYFCFREAVREMKKGSSLDRKEIIGDLVDIVGYINGAARKKLSLIIDNTLPSPELLNIFKNIPQDSATDVVVVESGTKHYQQGEDKVTLGVAYSNNPKKIEAIRKTRTLIGAYLQPSSLKKVPESSLAQMKEKMTRHAENALVLATELVASEQMEGVYHPNLPGHPDKELADKFSPQGIVSLFYAELKEMTSEELVRRVYEKGQGKIKIGGSFGHPETWILPLGEKLFRIAAGSEDKEGFREVVTIFKEALNQKK